MSQPYSDALEDSLSRIAEEGINDTREQLLLWLIRTVFDVGAADSYENVFSQPVVLEGEAVIDAATVIQRRDVTTAIYFVASSDVKDLRLRASALATRIASHAAPERVFSKLSPRLRSVFEPAVMSDSGSVVRTIVAVATADVTKAQLTGIEKSSNDPDVRIDALGPTFFNALAVAERDRLTSVIDVHVPVDSSSILNLNIPNTAAIVLPVYATDIATWPGVEDRTLFDLNVRHALGVNKVRKSLDLALQDTSSADQFIAYHNGITAVCRSFEVAKDHLAITGLSIVNGAQTVVAINANRDRIASGIRLLLKLVAAPSDSSFARSIAIRSNTQNPVTSRNLRALDAVQERLIAGVRDLGYVYVTRPDLDIPANARIITNDDVAQLLCSIYVRKPALAVKRQMLFENPQYQEIFPEDLDPQRVVFAQVLRDAVSAAADSVPAFYRSAWALTSLTLVYMSAEAMRASPEFSKILTSPGREDVMAREDLIARMKPFIDAACKVLHDRRAEFSDREDQVPDDFKVAFKQTRTLSDLGTAAARAWREMNRASPS